MKIFVSIDIAKSKYNSEPTQDEIWSALNKGIKYGLDAKGIAAPFDVKVGDVSDTKNEIVEMKIRELVSKYTELSDVYKEMWQEEKAKSECFADISFGIAQDVTDEIKSVNDYRELSVKRAKENGEELDEGGIKFAIDVLHNVLSKVVGRLEKGKSERWKSN